MVDSTGQDSKICVVLSHEGGSRVAIEGVREGLEGGPDRDPF